MSSGLAMRLKTIRQLGWRPALLYLQYQLFVRLGVYRLITAISRKRLLLFTGELIPLPFRLPPKDRLEEMLGEHVNDLLADADHILEGRMRYFGREYQPLQLKPSGRIRYWTKHTAAWVDGQDIKHIWEPGRFDWATVLARAYYLSGKEKYAGAFWEYTEGFLDSNPAYAGPNWSSGQEVALRLIALLYSYSVVSFSPHTSLARSKLLAEAIARHAARIPLTLSYARAQNNNHLLTEAVGLYTAAAALPNHPQAARWRKLGWKWLNYALQRQITADGVFIQHSANYHRLMLQTALWAAMVADRLEDTFPAETQEKLAAASRWLSHLLDEESGQVPNLGPNDGAYILPLTVLPYSDFRPVVQAAGQAFLGEKLLPEGVWDEMAEWLTTSPKQKAPVSAAQTPLTLTGQDSWASLRAAKFYARPGHADQLHLDLWWKGHNVALDAGSFSYNSPPPWQNVLSRTDVHNTVMVDGQDQMTWATRFLWLDWAQAEVLEKTDTRISARHNGYAKLGLTHTRTVELSPPNTWIIKDAISSDQQSEIKNHQFRLHCLFPDWPWELDRASLRLQSPQGWITIAVDSPDEMQVSLARGGERLAGDGDVPPQRGWISHTYGVKHPALSLAVVTKNTSTRFTTRIIFPE